MLMAGGRRLGAHPDVDAGTLSFRVFSAYATRVEAWIYDQPRSVAAVSSTLAGGNRQASG
jgi:hypothetical protein